MRTFGSNNNNKFGRRSSSRPRFDSRNSGQNTMHTAICGDCGKECQVPFMPSQDRPVYCSDCFEKRGNGKKGAEGGRSYKDSRDSRRPNFSNNRNFSGSDSRPQNNNKEILESIELKLNKILRIIDSK